MREGATKATNERMALGIEGTYTALVTPFRNEPSQAIDWEALDKLIDAQVQGGVTGLVPCGTTGESPTLSHEEHKEVIARTVKRAAGKAQVIGGTGSNSTREAIAMSKDAERSGGDAVRLVAPYYNRPTQEGIYQHYEKVASSVGIPLIVYNIPGRTGSKIEAETLARLSEIKNVAGVKEATGSVDQAIDVIRLCGDRLAVYSLSDTLNPLLDSCRGSA